MASKSTLTIAPAFRGKLQVLGTRIQPIMTEAMDQAMIDVQDVAREKYDWNEPGTHVVYPSGWDYQVTGAAIESITGFAVGTTRDPYEHFSMVDPVSGDVHSDAPQPMPNPVPGVVEGILTMSEPHSGYLQHWEIRGPSDTSPYLQGGESITTSAIRNNEFVVWLSLETTAMAALNAII